MNARVTPELRPIPGIDARYAVSRDAVCYSSFEGAWIPLRPHEGTVSLTTTEGKTTHRSLRRLCAQAWPELAEEMGQAARDGKSLGARRAAKNRAEKRAEKSAKNMVVLNEVAETISRLIAPSVRFDIDLVAMRLVELLSPSVAMNADAVATKVANKLNPRKVEIDVDLLAAQISNRIPAPSVHVDAEAIASRVVEMAMMRIGEAKVDSAPSLPADQLRSVVSDAVASASWGKAMMPGWQLDTAAIARELAAIMTTGEASSPSSATHDGYLCHLVDIACSDLDEDTVAEMLNVGLRAVRSWRRGRASVGPHADAVERLGALVLAARHDVTEDDVEEFMLAKSKCRFVESLEAPYHGGDA